MSKENGTDAPARKSTNDVFFAPVTGATPAAASVRRSPTLPDPIRVVASPSQESGRESATSPSPMMLIDEDDAAFVPVLSSISAEKCGNAKSQRRPTKDRRCRDGTVDLSPREFLERTEGLRITRILCCSNKDIPNDDNPWIVFLGRDRKSSERKWKGFVPRPDMYHEYSVLYREEVDEYASKNRDSSSSLSYGSDGPSKICAIKKILDVKRVAMCEDVLETILADGLAYGPEDARREILKLGERARGGDLSSLLRDAKDTEWLARAESLSPVFVEWYADELCPPFPKNAIKHLNKEAISKIAHLAATEPWRLCFWWMTGVPLLDELGLADAEKLAVRFGAPISEEAKFVVRAYAKRPFGDARGHGDSFVWVDGLRRMNPDADVDADPLPRNWLQLCLKTKVAKIVCEPEVDFLPVKLRRGDVASPTTTTTIAGALASCAYAVGDLQCESDVVELISKAVTRETDNTRVRRKTSWWPWCDPDAPTPNAEQESAIEAATTRRFAVIHGKPGTGKTSMAMRSLASTFERGVVVAVSFTGMSAKKMKATTKYGTTAHKVVSDYRRLGARSPYAGRTVLIIEEASTMPLRLLRAVLLAMGASLSRVYIFGDPRQMDPIGGGPSILRALVRRYEGTPLSAELKVSMRVSDATGSFVRDLDRICECRVDDGTFEWSPDPASSHPFVFLRRGDDAKGTVKAIRDALVAAGVNPDSRDVQIMTHTNEERTRLAREWYAAGPFASKYPYSEHAFAVGERIMFLENNNSKYKPRDSILQSAIVMNGTTGTVTRVFDEWPSKSPWHLDKPARTIDKTHTSDPASPGTRRWIEVDVEDGGGSESGRRGTTRRSAKIMVLLDRYGSNNIDRIPPVTIAKMQGQEVKIAILVLSRVSRELDASEIYTACSRGKERCFVVSDFDPTIAPESGKCPSGDFVATVMASKDKFHATTLWKKFPPCDETLLESVRVAQKTEKEDGSDEDALPKKRKRRKAKDGDDNESDDAPTKPNRKKRKKKQKL